MKAIVIWFILMLASTVAQAGEQLSASRVEGADYRSFIGRYSVQGNSLRATPLSSAVKYTQAQLPNATSWKSLAAMEERFAEARDLRFLESGRSGNFLRRISWLYPDDGCFARGALLNRNFFRMFVPLPKKVFVFGNLSVSTPYSPRGKVSWWFHTAPIIEVGNTKYVLDPAIEVRGPLTLQEWMERMGDPEKMEIAICESGTYSPNDDCSKENDGLEVRALAAQKHYLDLEWSRVQALGLSTNEVLGDSPPW